MYEVELKFPLTETERVLALLAELDAQRHAELRQADQYMAHPVRDFAQTNEAFRLRSVGDWNGLTYKGPLVDEQTKTRREIEVPFAEGADAADQMRELLQALGFRPVHVVRKTRTPFVLRWEDRNVEAVLDDVDGLGTFLELETTADDATLNAARDSLLRLATRLELENPERRSYLQLLLKKKRNP